MKLHHSVLITLASCVAASVALAENVNWEYASETTFNYTEGNTPDIPTDNGTITKTGAGTVILALTSSVSPDSDATIGGTASDYTGDVYINEGAIRFGSKSTNHGNNLNVSPDALGASGTIYVASGAQLQLGLAQHKTVAFNKNISLDGGELYLSDGNYTFSALNVTQSSTIRSQWSGKNHTFSAINASGQELTLAGEVTTYTINGSSSIGTLNINNNTVKTGGSVNISTITVGAGGTLWSDGSATPLNYDHLTLKGGAKLRLDNGNYWGTSVGNTGSAINIEASTDAPAVIAGGIYGTAHIRSTISGTGSLELRRSEHGYQNAINLDGAISGDLAIVQTSGNYNFNTTNSYTGGTTIMGARDHKITATANGALGSGNVTLVGSGMLVVNENKVQSNTVNFNSDATTTQATLTDASWEGNTLTGAGVTGGSITGGEDGGLLSVAGTHSLSNVTLNNMGVLVGEGATLTLEGTVGGSNTTVTVGSGATPLAEGDDVVAPEGGTLDLSNVTTLNANVILNDGATLILGEQPITMTGALTMNGTVTIDISAWCKNSEDIEGEKTVFTPYTTLFNFGEGADLSALDGQTVTLVVDGCTNENAWLAVSADGKSLQVVPEPATATLSLLALAGLCARRRRK